MKSVSVRGLSQTRAHTLDGKDDPKSITLFKQLRGARDP